MSGFYANERRLMLLSAVRLDGLGEYLTQDNETFDFEGLMSRFMMDFGVKFALNDELVL
jgi:hypothetical protein